jgi:hypothetical protein
LADGVEAVSPPEGEAADEETLEGVAVSGE